MILNFGEEKQPCVSPNSPKGDHLTLYRRYRNFPHPVAVEIADLGLLNKFRTWVWAQPTWKQLAIESGVTFAGMAIIAMLASCLQSFFL